MSLGGGIDFIELLEGDARDYARTRCVVTPEIERTVACGGFAAEFYLLNTGYAEQGAEDDRNIHRVLFHNATHDREDFWGRRLGIDEAFTEAEDRGFMNHAIGSDGFGGVIPIFDRHFSGMQKLARELLLSGSVDGSRAKKLLGLGIPR